MTTNNLLDPPPGRWGTARVPYLRIAAITAGVAIVAVVILMTVHMAFPRPNRQATMREPQVTVPPAVTPASEAQADAELQVLKRAANSPALGVVPVQVSAASPPVGAAPKGDGVTAASADVGPAG